MVLYCIILKHNNWQQLFQLVCYDYIPLLFNNKIGVYLSTDSYTLISIEVTLTKQGLVNINQVISTVMSYTKLLQGLNLTQWEQEWKQYIDVALVNFNYTSKSSPEDYVR